MRESTQQSEPARADRSARQSYHCILSGQNVRSIQDQRPLLGVLSEDPTVWLLWPGAVLDAVMVPQP